MADEFVKGLGVLTGGGLVWLVLAGWYKTPNFETQLTGEIPQGLDVFGQLAVALMGVMFWFTILGTLAFWIGVPVARELYGTLTEE